MATQDEDPSVRRRARSTRTMVALYAPGVLLVEEEGWITVCEAHGGCVGHASKRLAVGWLSHPEDWCAECQQGRAP